MTLSRVGDSHCQAYTKNRGPRRHDVRRQYVHLPLNRLSPPIREHPLMLLTIIRTSHVDLQKPILQGSYDGLSDAQDSRPHVQYLTHNIRLRIFILRNHDARGTMKLVRIHINFPLAHTCDCILFNATNKRQTRRPCATPRGGVALTY